MHYLLRIMDEPVCVVVQLVLVTAGARRWLLQLERLIDEMIRIFRKYR